MNKKHHIINSIYYLKCIWKIDRVRIPAAVVTTFINAFESWLLKIWVIKVIIDALSNTVVLHSILGVIGFSIVFKSLKLVYDWWWSYYVKKSDQKIIAGFQHIVFSKAADIDLQCYDNPQFYNSYTQSIQDSSTRPILFINSISQLLQTIFTVSFSGIYVILNDPVLLVFAIIPVLCDSFVRTKISKEKVRRTDLIIPENRKIEYVKRTSYLREYAIDIRTTNIRLILEKIYQNGIDNIINIYKKCSKKFIRLYLLSDCFTHLNNISIILYLVYKIVVLKSLTAGDFLGIKESISIISSNLGKIIERVQVFGEHNVYIERYKKFCQYENKVVFGTLKTPTLSSSEAEIEMKQVSFSYDEGTEILNNLNLSVKQGQLIGIVGLNGAGKSTLVKLLLHMYDPNIGSVEFRGEDIKKISKMDYLSHFDVVLQNHNNYAITLSNNVSFNTNLSEHEINKIKEVLCSCNCEELIQFIDKDVLLTKEFSENGLILSGGQTQKIALSRAIYRNGSILILDEPTSALDPISEHHLMKNIKRVAKERTIILISHRLSSVRDADCIYFVEKGQIVESGTHNELMEKQGKYSNMFSIQSNSYRV